jgi:hypothetical protein
MAHLLINIKSISTLHLIFNLLHLTNYLLIKICENINMSDKKPEGSALDLEDEDLFDKAED